MINKLIYLLKKKLNRPISWNEHIKYEGGTPTKTGYMNYRLQKLRHKGIKLYEVKWQDGKPIVTETTEIHD